MKRTALLTIMIVMMAAVLSFAQTRDLVDRDRAPRETVVQVNVKITDAAGRPMPDIMIQAQAVGRNATSLTDKSGTCGLELRTGKWVLKAIRLGAGGELIRREITVGNEKTLNVLLSLKPATNSGNKVASGSSSALFQGANRTSDLSARDFDRSGNQAAAELLHFTDSVLRQARYKILDQYASNKYSTSYWIEQQNGAADREIPSEGSATGYRFDLDLQGNTLSGARRGGAIGDLLSNSNALGTVPVNVTISVNNDRVNKYLNAFDFNLSGSGQGVDAGRSQAFIPLPRFNLSSITGGSENPETALGYDLGTGAELRALGNSTFRAFYSEISNHIVNLYRPLRAAASTQAIGSSDAIRGVELGVEKTFLGGLRATVLYSYTEGGVFDIRTVNLHFEDWQDFESFLENGLRHDLKTTLEAGISSTGTSVQAVYRLYLADMPDSGYSDRVSSLFNEHSRIDLSLQQRIDFGILSSARISFSLAVNNLLNSRRNSAILSTDPEDELNNRKLLGGIRIEF